MTLSGPKPRILPETEIHVQIDTTFHRSQTRISQGFQRVDAIFNRTLLSGNGLIVISFSESFPSLRRPDLHLFREV